MKSTLAHLSNVFFKNLFYGGLALGIGLTFVEYFRNRSDLVYLYAYVTSSFFIVQLYKYFYVNKSIPALSHGFIIHSIIGGTVYVVFILLMLYLFIMYQNTQTGKNIWVPGNYEGISNSKSLALVTWNVGLYLLTIFIYYVWLYRQYHH